MIIPQAAKMSHFTFKIDICAEVIFTRIGNSVRVELSATIVLYCTGHLAKSFFFLTSFNSFLLIHYLLIICVASICSVFIFPRTSAQLMHDESKFAMNSN